MQDVVQVFIEYLAHSGLKMTGQRRVILDVFLASDAHLTVEELYDKIKKEDPNIGQATVYRTMKLLSECGIAKEVHLGDSITRYEVKYGCHHHDHLVCECCGKSLGVVDERIEHLQCELAAKYGFQLTSHKMVLFGICPECQSKRDLNNKQ